MDSGTFEVIADRDNATTDPRSDNKIILDAITAVIKGRATKDQESYSINGRSLSRTPLKDLMDMQSHYQALYNGELRKEAIKNGLGHGGKIRVRL